MSNYKITKYSCDKATKLNLIIKISKNPLKKIDVYDIEGKFIASIGSSAHMDYPHYIEVYGLQYAQNRAGLPVAGPRSLNLDNIDEDEQPRKRIKRSIHITDRKVRSADVGVSGIYDVISEADLAFSPDTKQEAVTIFQGQIKEEVVYGICMPVPGFSILFILVISATIIAALVAGSLLYRYQLQKDALAHQQATSPINTSNSIASWMTLRLFKMRHPHHLHHSEPTVSELSEDSTSSSSRHAETRQ